MRFGGISSVTSQGLLLKYDTIKTVGIHKESGCWGIWLPIPIETYNETEKNYLKYTNNKSQLLITSIPPSCWPYMFRIQFKLLHHPGAISDATKVLDENGVNILYAQCTQSGHLHGTLNLIGEAIDLKRKYQLRYNEIINSGNQQNRKELLIEIIEELLSFLSSLKETIRTTNDDILKESFLRSSYEPSRIGSFAEDEFENKEIWNENKHLVHERVSYSIMNNLIYYLRVGKNINRPLHFIYDHEIKQLTAKNNELFIKEFEDEKYALPTKALTSFDTDENFIRLYILDKEQINKVFFLDLSYQMNFKKNGQIIIDSTKGLLNKITEEIKEKKINLIRIYNTIKRKSEQEEAGRIKFIGESPSSLEDDKKLLITLKDGIENINMPELKLDVKEVSRIYLDNIFLSIHQDAVCFVSIKKIVEERAKINGFNVIFSITESENVTENVITDMRRCSCFIQFLAARKNHARKRKPDLTWLTGEYFGAVALNLPVLRFVDITIMSIENWCNYLKFDKDRPLLGFDSRDEKFGNYIIEKINSFLCNKKIRRVEEDE